jgi:hypothetical protein
VGRRGEKDRERLDNGTARYKQFDKQNPGRGGTRFLLTPLFLLFPSFRNLAPLRIRQHAMNKMHRDSPFADSGCHALHVTGTNVADREYSG